MTDRSPREEIADFLIPSWQSLDRLNYVVLGDDATLLRYLPLATPKSERHACEGRDPDPSVSGSLEVPSLVALETHRLRKEPPS
jgi:hypothetical protein